MGVYKKLDLIYEGKAKKVFSTESAAHCVVSYKDDATAQNGKKRGTILGKGAVNNRVSNALMRLLEKNGVPTHLVEELSETDALVWKVAIIPLEVIVRNIAAGSFSARYGVAEGQPFATPTLEYCYKNDDLDDPLINDYHIEALRLASKSDLEEIARLAFKVNDVLKKFLLERNITLVDFKLEFGKNADGKIMLADEISPDTCRFWDTRTMKKLDKDVFRRDLGDTKAVYEEAERRILEGL